MNNIAPALQKTEISIKKLLHSPILKNYFPQMNVIENI